MDTPTSPASPADVIARLGGATFVARACGWPEGTVASWRSRNVNPVEAWPKLIALAADMDDVLLDAEILMRLHNEAHGAI